MAGQFLAAASQRPEIGRITTTFSAGTPNYRLEVDREKVKKLGVPVNELFTTLQTFLGGYQVNDFTRFGRNYKVTMQAESEFRQEIRDIALLFVRNDAGGHGAARHAHDCGPLLRHPLPAALQPVPYGGLQRLSGAGRQLWRCASGTRGSRRRGPAGRLRIRVGRAEPAGGRGGQCRRGRAWRSRSSSCSCSSPRCTRAGPCPSRCCSRRRSGSSAR